MDINDDDIFPCPECGEDCHEGDERCPSCGEDLSSYAKEETSSVNRASYELDEDSVKALTKVITKCIERIACECDYYDKETIDEDDDEDVIDSVLDNIAEGYDKEDLIGYIDTASGEDKGIEGFVFTNIGIIEKGEGYLLNLPYKAMGDMEIKDGKLFFLDTKGFGSGEMKEKDVYISETYYDIDALMRVCERIVSYLE